MAISFTQMQSSEEYKDLIQKYSYLVDQELSRIESQLSELTPQDVAGVLPKFISAINVIGYLRGQDGMFIEARPGSITFQKDLYENEDAFEERLRKLISYVKKDSKSFLQYRNLLNEYYLEARGLRSTKASFIPEG